MIMSYLLWDLPIRYAILSKSGKGCHVCVCVCVCARVHAHVALERKALHSIIMATLQNSLVLRAHVEIMSPTAH